MHTHLIIMADNHPYTNMPGSHDSSMSNAHEMNFEVSDFLEFSGWIEEDPGLYSTPESCNPSYTTNEVVVNSSGISSNLYEGTIDRNRSVSKEKKEIKDKVAFKTKSEVEVLDDGFKWRKYGKKKVKNSPNPRNYYRCSVERCPVKKRVERDKEDPCYVVTTYEGIHNHQGPHP
ncbi:hypothetical protein BUALT_Bualt05G0007600 [Buddleja alternifolia]|uniref:WRKY domain-containing protein n=1 Tax=Buddleja alternifolia TaxID=168488 RepID=A0AAV6XGY8_9LAMI|nr:hypothetical protein BUALT_Bualt05G0007600 [Buddleja alternifolia]